MIFNLPSIILLVLPSAAGDSLLVLCVAEKNGTEHVCIPERLLTGKVTVLIIELNNPVFLLRTEFLAVCFVFLHLCQVVNQKQIL